MLRTLKLFWVALLAFTLGLPSIASADAPGSSPIAAIPISGTMTGSLTPSQTRWYQVNYPGGSQSVGLVLSYDPNDSSTIGTVNLNVDWSNTQGTNNADWPGLYRIGQGTSNGLPTGILFWYAGPGNPVTYYVEVSNFSGETIGYALGYSTDTNRPSIPNPPPPGAPTSGVTPAAPSAPAPSAPAASAPAPTTPAAPAAATPAPAPPAPSNQPSSAGTLTAANSSITTSLVGDPGGAYNYFHIAYPGANLPLQVTIVFQPGYPSTGPQGFGFELYGPNGTSFESQPVGTNGSISTGQWTYASPSASDVLIQVFNYTAGMQVGYTLSVYGLAGGSSATLTGASNTTPDKAVDLTTLNASIGGTLAAPTSSGSPTSYFYTIHYPGGNAPLTFTMNATPPASGQNLPYGYAVTCPNPTGGQPLTASTAYPVSGDVNSTTLSSTWTQQSAATCTLAISNYWVGQAVHFGLSITGMAGPAPAASGNTTGDKAIALNSARPGATETLTNSGSDAFNYFVVNYPGNLSQLYVAITYSSTGGAPDNALGFQVYDGSTLETTIHPNDDGTGVHSGVWQYSNADPATFLIQVQNYAKSTTASYTLYQVGSQ